MSTLWEPVHINTHSHLFENYLPSALQGNQLCPGIKGMLCCCSTNPSYSEMFYTSMYCGMQKLHDAGVITSKTGWTMIGVHRWFRVKNTFPHPNALVQCNKKVVPKLFASFPEIKDMIKSYATRDLQTLSSENLAAHIRNNIIPILYKKHCMQCDEDGSTKYTMTSFLKILNLTEIHPTTALRWLGLLGFKFEPLKKTYYNDKHEEPENVDDRKQFINSYLNWEFRAFHWVQLSDTDAIELERDIKNPIPPNTFYSYKSRIIKMREYHIDTHPILFRYAQRKDMGGDHSVRMPKGSRPILLIGQDESVYKQFQFSSRAWKGPTGENTLLPTSDGYSKMVSCYIGRSFGMGLYVSDGKLHQINAWRQHSKKYLSEESAKNIYGVNKNQKLHLIMS